MDITIRQILMIAERAHTESGDNAGVLDELYTIEIASMNTDGMIHEGLVFFKTNDPKCKIWPLEELTVRAVRGGIE